MQRAQQYIATRQAQLAEHPFLRRLAAVPPLAEALPFVSQVSFFVLAFQDLVRMIADRASSPHLREVLRRHCEEEVGHERWFLQDLARLTGAAPDLATLFGRPHEPTRRATYGLVVEALTSRDDEERLCLLLTLEAGADAAFRAARVYFEQVGVARDLTYFNGAHLESERDHSVFEGEMRRILGALVLDDDALERACRAVDRDFAALFVMLDGLEETLARQTAR